MSVTIGSQLGSCEIKALLGKGGMGEVYRARDLRLNRDVLQNRRASPFRRMAGAREADGRAQLT